MVKQLGPILFMALLGGHALAQEHSPTTVRLGAPSLIPSPTISWGIERAEPPLSKPPPPLAPPTRETSSTPAVSILLALTDAF